MSNTEKVDNIMDTKSGKGCRMEELIVSQFNRVYTSETLQGGQVR